MKYFTFDWWADAGDTESPKPYFGYLERITPQLPPELQRFVRECSLHDGRVTRLVIDTAQKTVTLHLDGNCYDERLPKSYARRFRLAYLGVETFTSTADPNRGLGGPAGYGDLGYDEIELLEAGRFEHRMLFSSSIEFHIRFTDFSLWYEDYDYSTAG
jgi:hypothetical protein